MQERQSRRYLGTRRGCIGLRPYTLIAKDKWDNCLCEIIHAIACWLNPAFQYDQSSFCEKPEAIASLIDVIDSKLGGILVLRLWTRLGSSVIMGRDLKGI